MTAQDDRMPPLPREELDDAQRAAADELTAGPRKGVKGPFIPLLRSPRLLARLQKVGEYLRFESSLSRRVNELVTLVVARARCPPRARAGRGRPTRTAASTRARRSTPCARGGGRRG